VNAINNINVQSANWKLSTRFSSAFSRCDELVYLLVRTFVRNFSVVVCVDLCTCVDSCIYYPVNVLLLGCAITLCVLMC
jgi:hypothetical protein